MEFKTAIGILEYHQEWRQGKREDMIHEPEKLTEALDIVLGQVKNCNIPDVSFMLPSDDEITKYVNSLDTPEGCDQFSVDTGFVKGAIYMRELANKTLLKGN